MMAVVGVRRVYSAAPSPGTVPSTQFHKYVSEQSPVLLGDTSQATVTSKVEVREVGGLLEQPSVIRAKKERVFVVSRN